MLLMMMMLLLLLLLLLGVHMVYQLLLLQTQMLHARGSERQDGKEYEKKLVRGGVFRGGELNAHLSVLCLILWGVVGTSLRLGVRLVLRIIVHPMQLGHHPGRWGVHRGMV